MSQTDEHKYVVSDKPILKRLSNINRDKNKVASIGCQYVDPSFTRSKWRALPENKFKYHWNNNYLFTLN